MRRSRAVVAAGAVAALVLGVLAVRGGTAVDPAALGTDGAGTAAPTADPVPPQDTGATDALVLDANGLPGLRLGQRTDGAQAERLVVVDATLADGSRLPCDQAHVVAGPPVPGVVSLGWVRDGRVASVLLVSQWPRDEVAGDVRTWLGVTLGSPVEAVLELPGATAVVHEPFGAGPPGETLRVTVVRVPLPGGRRELLVSDAPPDGLSPGAGGAPPVGAGRVSTIELRDVAGRVCGLDGVAGLWSPAPLPAETDPLLAVRSDGVRLPDGTDLALGTAAADVAAAGFVAGPTVGQNRRCQRLRHPTLPLEAGVWDDELVSVRQQPVAPDGGEPGTARVEVAELGTVTGLGSPDLRRLVEQRPELLVRPRHDVVDALTGSGLRLRVGAGSEVHLRGYREVAAVPEVDLPVQGPGAVVSEVDLVAVDADGRGLPC